MLLLCAQKQHADFDIEPFLVGANPVFHKFIEDGLAAMEASDPQFTGTTRTRTENPTATVQQPAVLGETGQNGAKDADYWLERLKLIRVYDTISVILFGVLMFLFSISNIESNQYDGGNAERWRCRGSRESAASSQYAANAFGTSEKWL